MAGHCTRYEQQPGHLVPTGSDLRVAAGDRDVAMTTEIRPKAELRDTARAKLREVSTVWWWLLILGILWTAWACSFCPTGGQPVRGAALLAWPSATAASPSWWWPAGSRAGGGCSVLTGILGVAAGITAFVWPGVTLYIVSILVAWYLVVFGIVHVVDALAGSKLPCWWTGLRRSVSGVRGSSKTETPQARLWRRLSANPGGAISGTIIAMSVIAAADRHASAGTTLTLTVTTLLVSGLRTCTPRSSLNGCIASTA